MYPGSGVVLDRIESWSLHPNLLCVWYAFAYFHCYLVVSAGKGLTSWLGFVMFNCVFSLYHMVSWVRCGTWLYRYLIFAAFLTLNVAALYVCFAFPFPSLFAHVRIVHTSHKSFRANVCTRNNLTHIDSTRGLRYLHTTNNWPQANLVRMYALTNYWSR